MMRSIRFAPASLFGAVLSLCILGLSSMAGAEPLTVRFEWLPHAHHSWFHYAQEKGWYKAEGLDVKFEDGRGSVTTVQLVGSGKYNIGLASLSAMAAGVAKGVPVRAIASIARKNEIGVDVPKGSGWKSPKDLVDNNVKIVSTSGGFEQPFLEAFFRNGGTDINKAQILRVGAANLWSTYLNGEADAMISAPPYDMPYLQEARASEGFMMSDFGLEMPGLGLLANVDTIKNRPDDLRKFLKVTFRAFGYIIDGHEQEGMEALVRARPDEKIDVQKNLTQIENYRPLYVTEASKGKPWGYMAPADWSKAIGVLKDAGVLPASMTAADLYTNAFIAN